MASQSKLVTKSPPVVSIAMTAYNSEQWIARAIESVLKQTVEFPLEIIVGDDCSTDNTASIVQTYLEQHPDRVRLLRRDQNIGMQRNFYETFEQCQGRYVAWLDADDYWTDPDKLTLQVRVLEGDPSISICGHFVRSVRESGEVAVARYPTRAAGRYGLKDVILQNFVPSPSIVFRNGLHRKLPAWFFDLTGIADWPLLLAGACTGDVLLLDRVMADYSYTPTGAYSSKSFAHQHALDLEVRERMMDLVPRMYDRVVRAGIGKQYEALAYHYRVRGNFRSSRQAALNALRIPALRDNLGSKSKTFLLAFTGSLSDRFRPRPAQQ